MLIGASVTERIVQESDDLDAVATASDTAADVPRTVPTLNVVVSAGKTV
jgi:hypothetical protein